MEIEEYIKDAFEDSMQNYTQTEDYKNAQCEINEMILSFRVFLSSKQQFRFNEIIDAITVADGKLAAEAYLHGIVEGIALREKVNPIS